MYPTLSAMKDEGLRDDRGGLSCVDYCRTHKEISMDSIRYIDRKSGKVCQEIVPGERWLKWLYHNPLGRLALDAVVKRKVVSQFYGNKMDAPSSKDKIASFVEALRIDMSEAIKSIDQYSSFNNFFIRELKPEARPIDSTPDSVVSPADGKVLAFDGINGLDSFFIKGQSFSLKEFLNDDTLAEKYNDGILMIIRLAPVDYHRFHFPADGQISRSTPINGDYYSVSPYAVKKRLSIYWENKREYSILKSRIAGDILLCEVGATMVGSIIQSYRENSEVTKGQEKGWFKFGGSTVVALFEKGSIRVDQDIISNTNKGFETSIRMGEQIATAS